jgi:hypothetical protein
MHEVEYPEYGKLLASYAAPSMPKTAYNYGLHEGGKPKQLSRFGEEIVLRWLETAKPSILNTDARLVLGAERCVHLFFLKKKGKRQI